jgi:transposase
VIFSEGFLPSKRKLYWKKQRLAITDAPTGYCGFVPAVRSSGEHEQQGLITRQGRSEVRAVWIQAAHSRAQILWATPGLRTAIVALAKKMPSLAFYLSRDGRSMTRCG